MLGVRDCLYKLAWCIRGVELSICMVTCKGWPPRLARARHLSATSAQPQGSVDAPAESKQYALSQRQPVVSAGALGGAEQQLRQVGA